MLKLAMVAPLQQALDVDADGEKQLPVDIPLGREFIFNSIFACPVSREQVGVHLGFGLWLESAWHLGGRGARAELCAARSRNGLVPP